MIITNLKSQNTGRSLPNQKILTVDTPCGHVHLFQSYKIPISFIVFTPHGRYFIETSTAYSYKITTYQDQFRKSFLLNFSYFKVNNIGQWIRALNNPEQFKKLIQTQKDCRLERGTQNVQKNNARKPLKTL